MCSIAVITSGTSQVDRRKTTSCFGQTQLFLFALWCNSHASCFLCFVTLARSVLFLCDVAIQNNTSITTHTISIYIIAPRFIFSITKHIPSLIDCVLWRSVSLSSVITNCSKCLTFNSTSFFFCWKCKNC